MNFVYMHCIYLLNVSNKRFENSLIIYLTTLVQTFSNNNTVGSYAHSVRNNSGLQVRPPLKIYLFAIANPGLQGVGQ
jgi:hypothetical protein